jgi:hypothetical protein
LQKIKLYTIGLGLVCLVFGISLLVLVNSLSPDRLGNILLFYFVSAIFVFSGTALAGFLVRKTLGQREILHHHLRQAIRQGLWFTLLLVISLFLLSRGFFNWISGGLLTLTLIFLEAYLLTKNDRKP